MQHCQPLLMELEIGIFQLFIVPIFCTGQTPNRILTTGINCSVVPFIDRYTRALASHCHFQSSASAIFIFIIITSVIFRTILSLSVKKSCINKVQYSIVSQNKWLGSPDNFPNIAVFAKLIS